MKRLIACLTAALVCLGLTACTPDAQTTIEKDSKNSATQLSRYQKNQPVPQYDWSQYRQTLIDVESAQVHGVATTTFFFNQGVRGPVKVCPSIGFAMPSTAQLTAPDQVVGYESTPAVVAQSENNGVYTGDSSGTYVVCVSASGVKFISYWEGFVHVEGGPAHWDEKTGMIVDDGAPTVIAKTK